MYREKTIAICQGYCVTLLYDLTSLMQTDSETDEHTRTEADQGQSSKVAANGCGCIDGQFGVRILLMNAHILITLFNLLFPVADYHW